MKKTLAILLSAALLFTAIFVGMPLTVAAEDTTAPIEATPLSFTIGRTFTIGEGNTATATTLKPISDTSAQGRKWAMNGAELKASGDGSVMFANAGVGERFTFNYKPAATDAAFMFYLETDGPVTFMPIFTDEGNEFYFIKEDAKVEILELNASEAKWNEIDTVQKPNETSAAEGYRTAIVLNASFKGYIKIAYTDINSKYASRINNGVHTIGYCQTLFDILGGTDRADNVTVGPFFNVTSDSNSTEIDIQIIAKPMEYEIGNYFQFSSSICTAFNSLSYTTAIGQKWELNGTTYVPKATAGGAEDTKLFTGSPVGQRFTFNSAPAATDAAFMFYLETDGPVTFMPTFQDGNGENYFIKNNATVEILEIDAAEPTWTDCVTTIKDDETNAPAGYRTVIALDKSFKGYIKIAYADIRSQYDASIVNGTRTIKFCQILFKELGGTGTDATNNVIIGPFFNVTMDGTSVDIEVPVDSRTQPIEAAPLKYSVENVYKLGTPTKVKPLSYTGAEGLKWELNDSECFANTDGSVIYGSDVVGIRLGMNGFTPSNGGALIFYLETNGPVTFMPVFRADKSDGGNHFIKNGAKVQTLEIGNTRWNELKTVKKDTETAADEGYRTVIELGSNFKGYIKINYSDIGSITSNSHTIYYAQLFFDKLGTSDRADTLVVGPLFNTIANSHSVEEMVLVSNTGDANLDGAVDSDDLATMRSYLLNNTEALSKYINKYGNVDGKGGIDLLDLVYLKKTIQPAAE